MRCLSLADVYEMTFDGDLTRKDAVEIIRVLINHIERYEGNIVGEPDINDAVDLINNIVGLEW